MSLTKAFGDWFWTPSFWLPNNHTWEELTSSSVVKYPDWRDICTYPIVIAIAILFMRAYVFYPFVFTPIAKSFGLTVKKSKPPAPNKALESIYLSNNGCVPVKAIEEAAVSLQLTQRQVERWLRNRSAMTKLTKLDKFNESAFVFSYHLVSSLCTLGVLFFKPWLWDISLCFINYPFYDVENDLWWVYMSCASYYWSQLLWQFKHSHGNDANLSYAHHFVTIFLLSFSWMCNFVRIGSLVILVHEFGGDVFLQLGKMCRYVKREENYMETIYVLFSCSWLLSRMVVYPFHICRYSFFEAPKFMYMPSSYVFFFLLFVLLVINCCWTSFLLVAIYRRITKGSIEIVASSEDGMRTETESDRKTD